MKKLIMYVFAMLLLIGVAHAENRADFNLGDYEYSLPSSWRVVEADENMRYHYQYDTVEAGAFVMAACNPLSAKNGVQDEVLMEQFFRGVLSGMQDPVVRELSVTCDAVGNLIAHSIEVDFLLDGQCYTAMMYAWIDTSNIYMFSYTDVTKNYKARAMWFKTFLSEVSCASVTRNYDEHEYGFVICSIPDGWSKFSDQNVDVYTNAMSEELADERIVVVVENMDIGSLNVEILYEMFAEQMFEEVSESFHLQMVDWYGKKAAIAYGDIFNGKQYVFMVYDQSQIVLFEYTCSIGIEEIESEFMTLQSMIRPVTFDVIEELDNDFVVVGYPYTTGRYHKLYLAITNNTGRDIAIEVSVQFFDADGGLVGVENEDIYAIAAGTQVLASVSNDLPFASYEYEIVDDDETVFACVNDQITVDKTVVANKVILGFRNDADVAAEFLEYHVLFMKDGSVVDAGWGYATDKDSEIKPGKTQYVEESTSEDFDDVLVFYTCRGDR